jgi:hypothetical protein
MILELFRVVFSLRRKLLAARTLMPPATSEEPGPSGVQQQDESGKRSPRAEDEDEDEGEPSLDGSRAGDTGELFAVIVPAMWHLNCIQIAIIPILILNYMTMSYNSFIYCRCSI